MAYLIDGNNLMGQSDPYFKYDLSSRNHLVARLLIFQKTTRKRIFLVFDGKPPSDDHLLRLNPKFLVLFPQPGQSADELIEDLLTQKRDRRYFKVVSSDRGVREIARAKGADSISSQEFLKELKEILKKGRQERELKKEIEDSTPLELSLWDELLSRK
ncbi:MAG: NYN domain-containing protein [Candidatus Saccharicenans sp.]|nr:MAG: hypothetical protein C0168_01420 [Candidatus Aminicenantes bacterium]HEK85372.1 hypothetical protein [Candidatus Aminicenantes bacterium]